MLREEVVVRRGCASVPMEVPFSVSDCAVMLFVAPRLSIGPPLLEKVTPAFGAVTVNVSVAPPTKFKVAPSVELICTLPLLVAALKVVKLPELVPKIGALALVALNAKD